MRVDGTGQVSQNLDVTDILPTSYLQVL
jgi:hypothetical protein